MINYLIKKKKIKNIFFIIGSDNLITLHKWKSWKKIVKLSKLIVFSRKGYDRKSKKSKVARYLKNKIIFINNNPIVISSTNLRQKNRISNYLFTSNPKQIERFYSIFSDLNAEVQIHPVPYAINEGFVDPALNIACYTDHQIFQRFHRFKLKKGFTKSQAMNLKLLRELKPGDYITHIDHGVGQFSV